MGKRINTAKWMENQKRWMIKVQRDGIRKSFYSSKPGRTGQREANAKADAWLDDYIENDSCKVSKAYELYLADADLRSPPENNLGERSLVGKWVLPAIGNLKLSALTDQKLQDVVNRAYSEGHLSKATLKNLRGSMVRMLKYCRKAKMTTYRPEDISIPAQAAKKGKEILQPDELAVLLSDDTTMIQNKVTHEPFIEGYRLQVLMGLRPGELLGLRKSDRVGNVVHIQRAINIYGTTTTGKNADAVRSVVLIPLAQEAWDRQAASVTTDSLFPSISQEIYRHHLSKYCRYHHITEISPYSLRHTFISIVKNLPAGIVKDIVGHAESMDTFGVYGHAVDGETDYVSAAVSECFDKILNP